MSNVDELLALRKWLIQLCEKHGAKIDGTGFGFGQADFDLEYVGSRFNVSIAPLDPSEAELSATH
jgi:hypothetical protein